MFKQSVGSKLRVPIVAASAMAFNQVTTAIFGVFLAAYLQAEIYGLLNLARSIFTIALVVAPLGLDLALQRHIGSRDGEAAQTIAEVLWVRLIAFLLSTVVVLILYAGGASFLEEYVFPHANFKIALLIMMTALPFAADLAVLGGFQRGIAKPIPSLITSYILQPAARVLFVLALLIPFGGFRAATFGTLLSYIVAWAALVFFTRKAFRISAHKLFNAKKAVCEIFVYSPILGLSFLVFTIARSLDTIMLGYFAPLVEVGQYGLAVMVGQIVGMVGASVGQTVGTQLSTAGTSGDYPRLMMILSNNVRLTSILCAPLCAEVAVWGADIDLLLGPTFVLSPIVFCFVALSQFVQTSTQNSGWPLVAANKQTLELYNNTFALVIQTFACFILIPKYGAIGAALSTLIAIAGMAWLRQIQLKRIFGGRVVELWMLLPLVGAFLLALGLSAIQRQYDFRAWWLTGSFVIVHLTLCSVLGWLAWQHVNRKNSPCS